jgi:hypothetical protein
MDNLIHRSWARIRNAILSRWPHQVDEDDLAMPMSYDELCRYFGSKCGFSREEAKETADRLLQEAGNMPPMGR